MSDAARRAYAQAAEELKDLEEIAMSDELVEAVARKMCEIAYSHIPNLDIGEQAEDPYWQQQATAAIALIRPATRAEALEEALAVTRECMSAQMAYAAIEALMEKKDG